VIRSTVQCSVEGGQEDGLCRWAGYEMESDAESDAWEFRLHCVAVRP